MNIRQVLKHGGFRLSEVQSDQPVTYPKLSSGDTVFSIAWIRAPFKIESRGLCLYSGEGKECGFVTKPGNGKFRIFMPGSSRTETVLGLHPSYKNNTNIEIDGFYDRIEDCIVLTCDVNIAKIGAVFGNKGSPLINRPDLVFKNDGSLRSNSFVVGQFHGGKNCEEKFLSEETERNRKEMLAIPYLKKRKYSKKPKVLRAAEKIFKYIAEDIEGRAYTYRFEFSSGEYKIIFKHKTVDHWGGSLILEKTRSGLIKKCEIQFEFYYPTTHYRRVFNCKDSESVMFYVMKKLDSKYPHLNVTSGDNRAIFDKIQVMDVPT